jgi:RNA polymerase sigma-70 factor (ECF subfamily)
MTGETAESELISLCRSGDQSAWDELFGRIYDPVLCYVFQLSSDITHEDAEEIVQEALVSFVRGLASFRGSSSVRTWLFRIAANRAHDFLDRKQAQKRGGGAGTISLNAGESGGLLLDPASDRPGPSELAEIGDDSRSIHRALSAMGSDCREIIELRYFGDLSYDEIATALRLNAKTVSSRLSRCMRHLAETFSRQEKEGGGSAVLPSKISETT